MSMNFCFDAALNKKIKQVLLIPQNYRYILTFIFHVCAVSFAPYFIKWIGLVAIGRVAMANEIERIIMCELETS